MFTKLYGLPKERQTAFSNNACSCLRCASCVKVVLIKRIYLSAPVRIIEFRLSRFGSTCTIYARRMGVVSCLSVYKRHFCTELISWEHVACPLSGIKRRPLVGG